MTLDVIRLRVRDLVSDLGFVVSQTPFSFDLQPSGAVNQVFRIETQGVSVLGGFNFLEERTDALIIWLARKYAGDPEGMYQLLIVDAETIRSAIIHDGAEDSGEYFVPDEGSGLVIERNPGQEYAVVRLLIPVNYELTV